MSTNNINVNHVATSRLRINKRFFSTVFLSAFLLSSASAGQEKSMHANFDGQGKNTVISVFVPQKAFCGLTYTSLTGQQETLNFKGSTVRDTVITQSLNLASPTAFVWGYLQPNDNKRPGLSLTKYAILAKPGDQINLVLNTKYQLSNKLSGEASQFLADNTAPFYAMQTFGKSNDKKLDNNDSKAAYVASNNDYYNDLLAAYQKEIDRLNGLKDHSEMDASTFAAANFYAKAFFYDKLFVLVNESGRYPDAVLPILEKHIPEAEKMLKEPDLVLSSEVVRTMAGLVKAKLMSRKTNWNDFLNLYEEGKKMDLGIFKPTFLTYCLANYPAKQLTNYRNAVADFNNSYAGTVYHQYIDGMLQRSNKPIALPALEKFTTTENQSFSINDIVKKASTSFVIIDFWASWCAPCRQQFPVIDSLKRVFIEQDLPVTFISVNMDEDKGKWFKAAKDEAKYLMQHSYHLENPKKSRFVKELNIDAIPYTIVLKDGKIVANKFTLPVELSFMKDLTTLINQQVTSPLFTFK